MADQIDGNAGALLVKSLKGNSEALSRGYANVSGSKPDADYTLLAAEYSCLYVDLTFTGWTTGRNVIVPTSAAGHGVPYIVKNATGQTATIKTSGGTGIALANGKTAVLYENGTNVVRVTADNP